MEDLPSLELLARWRDQGDHQAAETLYHRYVGRLVALARKQLSPKMGRRVDAEDVVQSACKSFFLRVRDGRLELRPGNDLWQLLTAITLHKVHGQVQHHTAGKRSVLQEDSFRAGDSDCPLPLEALAREPGPVEIAAVNEERERVLRGLKPLHRQMVELRLEQWTIPEIARKTGRSERMVRLVLSELGKSLQQQLQPVSWS